MLDRFSPAQRHAALLAIAAVLGFVATNIDLFGLPDNVKAVLAPVVTFLLAYVTPLTNQYGASKLAEGTEDPALAEDGVE